MKVLILAHDFPGLGNRGVSVIRRLPKHGIQPVVLTNSHQSECDDADFTFQLEREGVEIVNTFAVRRSPFRVFRRFLRLPRLTAFLDGLFFLPDFHVLWFPFALFAARKLIREQKISVVMTISPPESIHLLGMALQHLMGVRWIANFEDLWSSKSHVNGKPTALHDHVVRSLEDQVYRKCDLLLANTEGNGRIYSEVFEVPSKKVGLLHLGYDPAEHEIGTPVIAEKVLRVGYLGSLTKELFPWREFVDAFKAAMNAGADVRLEICGHVSEEGRRYFEVLGLMKHVILHGVLSHQEAVEKIQACDVLVVLLYETDYSRAIVPHKLYHYLGMKKPIVGIADEDGEVASILERTRCGSVVSKQRWEGLRDSLVQYANEKQKHRRIGFAPNEEAIGRYDINRISESLAGYLKELPPPARRISA